MEIPLIDEGLSDAGQPLEGLWRWGESNPRPRTRTTRIYRFVHPFGLSKPGARDGALPRFVFRFVFLPAPRTAREVSPGQLQTFPTLRAAHRDVRRSTLLTRRERDCHCCWQVKVCRMLGGRRLHLQRMIRTARVETSAPPITDRIVLIAAAQRQHALEQGYSSHGREFSGRLVYSAGIASSMMPPPKTRPSPE